MRTSSIPKRIPAVITGILATFLLAGLSGCGGGSKASVAPIERLTPSRDPAVVQYRAVIDVDMRAITFALDKEACSTRSECTNELINIKAATDAMLVDLGTGAPPPAIGVPIERLKVAAQDFRDQLDAALIVVQQPNSNYFAAGAAPTVHDLYLAAGYLDCWPDQPVNAPGEGDYSCA